MRMTEVVLVVWTDSVGKGGLTGLATIKETQRVGSSVGADSKHDRSRARGRQMIMGEEQASQHGVPRRYLVSCP